MSRLTAHELKVLRSIEKKAGIVGRKHIERFIWCNTTEPKYEVGDKVVYTKRGHYIYGNPMKEWVGTITERIWNAGVGEKYISYKLSVKYEVDGSIEEATAYILENEVIKKNNRLKGINKIAVKKNKHKESLSI